MKRVLLQLDSDDLPSAFDAITALDSGVDHLLQYSSIQPHDVEALVHGAIFTRGMEKLKNTAIFIGGSDIAMGEGNLKAVNEAFIGPVRVSVMLDSNGCNTTAAAAVRKIISAGDIRGKKVVILAGTGPVGVSAAALMAEEGAVVTITSRSEIKAKDCCKSIVKRFGHDVHSFVVTDFEDTQRALAGAHAVFCTGAAGVTLLPESVWKEHSTLKVLADVNAVPPLGIDNSKPHWNGKDVNGKVVFGALGVGGLKIRLHRACVTRLFEDNTTVLDAYEVYQVAKTMD
jgi:hypothetical protein